MYRYIVLCKVFPKSGFDLAKHNKILKVMKDSLNNLLEEESDESFRNNIQGFFNDSLESDKGYVIEAVPIASENTVNNPEVDFMPTIRKKYPEAILGKCIALFNTSRLTTELVFA